MIILPAIDIKDGLCVRLYQGDYGKVTTYGADPAGVALRWQNAGASWLHVVDLDGAAQGKPVNTELIARIRKETRLHIQVGGGMRSPEHIAQILDLGVDRVILGTVALTDRALLEDALERRGERSDVGVDARKGRVVKGINFLNLRDAGDPVELASYYNDEGADEVVFLDITASYENRATMLDVVRRTAEQVFIPVTVGGGIRTVEDIRATLGAGADKTSLNTAAVQNPDLLRAGAEQFGAQCIVLAIDARSNAAMPSGYEVFIHGGRTPTGIDVVAWAQRGVQLGAGEILLTSMDRDGTKQGYDLALNAKIY